MWVLGGFVVVLLSFSILMFRFVVSSVCILWCSCVFVMLWLDVMMLMFGWWLLFGMCFRCF